MSWGLARFSLNLLPDMMESLKTKIEIVEKEAIIRALDECDWVKAKAAKYLGITERMIGYKMKKYKITKGERKE